MSREFSAIMHTLVARYSWQQLDLRCLCQDSRSFKDSLLTRYERLPEVLLLWDSASLLNPRARELEELTCLKCIFVDDLHGRGEEDRRWRSIPFLVCDIIFSTYGYVFADFYPTVARLKNIVWIPHAASPDFLLPFNTQAANAIFLSGAVSHHYPLREQLEALSDTGAYPIVYHPHPGYHHHYRYEVDTSVGRGYATKIHAYRTGFTDASNFRYMVAKYFEIPATGALLLADESVQAPLRELGFHAGTHYISASSANLEKQIRYVLDTKHHAEIDQIRKNAQQLVWTQHQTDNRAQHIDAVCTTGRV